MLLRRLFSLRSNLEELGNLVTQLKQTSQVNEKVRMLKEHPQLHEVLRMIYDPNVNFHFTSNSLKTIEHIPIQSPVSDTLSAWIQNILQSPAKNAKELVKKTITEHPEFRELIECIIDRNLKCRIGPKLLQRCMGHPLDDAFACTLAYDWKEALSRKFLEENGPWLYSRKLDGVRCVTRISPESIQMHSRQGKAFLGPLNYFSEGLEQLGRSIIGPPGTYILDGELCVMDAYDKEDFTRTSGLVRSSSIAPGTNMWYFIFDCLTEHEVRNPSEAAKFSTRLARVPNGIQNIVPLAHFPVPSEHPIVSFIDGLLGERCLQFGHEGLMLRLDTAGHYPGRSRTLLKVKQWEDAEFPVVALETGPIRYLQDGLEKEDILVSSLIVKLENGQTCGVGSGLSIEQRKTFDHSIIGKLVTVKFQGRMDGLLRFPIFKGIRDE